MQRWEFWIDVGGTFTDCLARTPDERIVTCKVLSTGVIKGRIDRIVDESSFEDESRRGAPAEFFRGYHFRLLNARGQPCQASLVSGFDAHSGTLTLEAPLQKSAQPGWVYELTGGEEAPLVAIRTLLKLRRDEPIPPVSVKLGTTRGTNALLTRRGARTAFVTTKGFGDVLKIANQDRPRLFDLAIQKPTPVYETVVEIDERVTAQGDVLRAPNEEEIRDQLSRLKATGVESLAICLLHGFAHPAHEHLVERLAREAGFTEISVSSRLAPLIKIVSRGDTTTVDAFLNPILRRYVENLKEALPGSQLRLMTSAGGLVEADRFVGKDSILSGPAGGVIGFSRIAKEAGFEKSIGFDMGGTSTDVSRFDGRYELEYETRKAGVRVVAPMLAVETVAAGGGSICGFDGVKLTVGPDSAGAEPGPACYGRGGPLTVTDVNLFLGKVLPHRFPFPLDREAVARRLNELCQRIASSATPHKYSPHELAEGFVRVANANMVRPIRNISVARGYDPREYALVTFGGAGAQHACAVARELGIRQVLSHPWSGLLSAYGIGLADVRRFGERAVLKPYSRVALDELETVFQSLESEALRAVREEGVPDEQISPPERSLDLRYQGVEAAINTPCPADGDYAAKYLELHRQLYGYVHDRPVEIVVARVEVTGRMVDPPDVKQELHSRTPEPTERTQTWFEGAWHKTAVYLRSELRPGDRLAGPAIVCEPTSTVVVDPGCQAQVLARGELLIDIVSTSATSNAESTQADPIRLEIFNNLFASIAEQMGTTLQRTSFSTNVKERLDFSCAIFTPLGDLVVNAPHIPVHLGAMGETVKRIVADNPQMVPGDVFVTNDPYRGGSHLPDVTVVTPVHHPDSGELLFFTASRAHHAEIGGIVPGSMPPFSKNLGEEGVLIRNFKLVDGGTNREDALRELLLSGPYPSRSVKDNLADVAAEVAANRSGATQLLGLVERYSQPVVQAYMGHIQAAAEQKMRSALRGKLQQAGPDASARKRVFKFLEHLDDGTPIQATIAIENDSATVDFTGSGPVSAGNLNANRAIVTAATLYVFRCLINEDIPLNSGVLAPVRLVIPEGVLSPPENADPAKSAAMVGGNVETSQRVVDALIGALGVAAASQGTMNNLTFGDGTFGYYETICGGSGATAEAEGADAVHTHMTNTRLTDVEVIERRYPVRILEFSIREGSGGAGRHRGGHGITRRIEFLRPLRVSILSERRGPYAPFGQAGGAPGGLGKNTLYRQASGQTESLAGKVQLEVEAGDVVTIETPGGGGFGAVP